MMQDSCDTFDNLTCNSIFHSVISGLWHLKEQCVRRGHWLAQLAVQLVVPLAGTAQETWTAGASWLAC